MNGYIDRLIVCGLTHREATDIYSDFVRNFSLVDLEVYVRYMESKINVG